MEINKVNVNRLDADALLPPRKRLLAGLKRQHSDVNNSSSTMSEFDTRVNNLLRSHSSSSSLLSVDIVEASRLAAMEATKVAEAARATAEEKAAKAAKAMAAAKSALELVDILSEEAASKEKYLKKSKMKQHDPSKGVRNSKTEEELARKLHSANSSPRISKTSSSSDLNNSKCKRFKRLTSKKVHNGGSVLDGNQPSMSNGIATVPGGNLIAVDLKVQTGEGSHSNNIDRLKLENGEAKIIRSKEKFIESLDDLCSYSKTRGKFKRKMLPLSICNSKDQISPKEEQKSKTSRAFSQPCDTC